MRNRCGLGGRRGDLEVDRVTRFGRVLCFWSYWCKSFSNFLGLMTSICVENNVLDDFFFDVLFKTGDGTGMEGVDG